jgi:hypothetical protein
MNQVAAPIKKMHAKRLGRLRKRQLDTETELSDAAYAAASDGMTVTEMAEAIGMSRTWAWKLVQRGQDQAEERAQGARIERLEE